MLAAATWQTFFVLTGTAAATLVGLMFVAVTFGANLVKPETAATARAFIDPPFTHFVQVLVMACFAVIPGVKASVLGPLLLVVGTLRLVYLPRVYRLMRAADSVHHDVDLSDWLTTIVLPALCHGLLLAAGVGFIAGWGAAFHLFAAVTIAILVTGVFGAWELILWMVVSNARAR